MKTDARIVELIQKIEALDQWNLILTYNWVVRSRLSPFPYFCTATMRRMEGGRIVHQLHLIEGWEAVHWTMLARKNPEYGYANPDAERPAFRILFAGANSQVIRQDTGRFPRELTPSESELVYAILWQTYGLVMRFSEDQNLPLKYSSARPAVFARVEKSPGVWEDAPEPIPPPRPYKEVVAISKQLLAEANRQPILKEVTWEVAFVRRDSSERIWKGQPFPYLFTVVDYAASAFVCREEFTIAPDLTLKDMWQGQANLLLQTMIKVHAVPSEVHVDNARLYRFLSPLCRELPIKLKKIARYETPLMQKVVEMEVLR